MRNVLAAFVVLIMVLFIYFMGSDSGYSKYDRIMKDRLLKKAVIHNDTLIVTDYNLFKDRYFLSNGVTVSGVIIDSLIIK